MIIEENIQVDELPGLWNEKMEELLGITPPDDAEGILQDPHWGGGYGYFPTYALGNLYGAQIYNKALKEIPNLNEDFKKGEFKNLLDYLNENVYQYGKIYRPSDLIKRISGEDLNPDYFIKRIEEKFYPIYNL